MSHSNSNGARPWALWILLLVIAVGGSLAVIFRPVPPAPISMPLVPTGADLSPVHSQVFVNGQVVRQLTRIADGSEISTDEGGRARIRLDNGTTLVLDGDTQIVVRDQAVEIKRGRVFANAEAKTTFDLGEGVVTAVSSAVAFERGALRQAYVADGEVSATIGGKDFVGRTGETIHFGEGGSVKPERGFLDWTGGLAAPWAADGEPRRALGELWSRTGRGAAGSPLTIRTHDVRATVYGEFAKTTIRTTFFNAGEAEVLGDFRLGVPSGAQVSGFAVTRGDQRRVGKLTMAGRGRFDDIDTALGGTVDILEWAGEGWLRGSIRKIGPGKVVTVEVTYIEWLNAVKYGDSTLVQYRLPLSGEASTTVGDFLVEVDAGPSGATELRSGLGGKIVGNSVRLKKSDFKPTADFVVDVVIPGALPEARAFLSRADAPEEEDTIYVRTEIPRLEGTAEEGVTLALVLDVSQSVEPSSLEASIALVEALIKSLGAKDRVVVLASAAKIAPVGPAEIGPATADRKAAIEAGLRSIERGGATDLGAALEAASNLLPSDAPSAMVVYIGDGFPSVGDRTSDDLRARLARRKLGVPRLGAAMVGGITNRRMMAELVRGSGPVVDVSDSEEAARASVTLLSSALLPSVTGVSIDLGPDASQVYPRREQTAVQGSTFGASAKLAHAPPESVVLRYRSGTEEKSIKRKLVTVDNESLYGDVVRRWAHARAEAAAMAGKGRETVTDVALRAELLTPWTLFAVGGGSGEVFGTPFFSRMLESGGHTSGFELEMAPSRSNPFGIASENEVWRGSYSMEEGLRSAALRVLEEARPQFEACRAPRLLAVPTLSASSAIRFKLSGEGTLSDLRVIADDEILKRCLTTLTESLRFPSGFDKATVDVEHTLVWAPPQNLKGKKCSDASRLALPLRRGLWREELASGSFAEGFLRAKSRCELGTWAAKRTMLDLIIAMLEERPSRPSMPLLELAKNLRAESESEAALYLEKQALVKAEPAEMQAVRMTLLSGEKLPYVDFLTAYGKATTNAARLAVVRKFQTLAPHDSRLRSQELSLLAEEKKVEELRIAAQAIRSDPYADAPLLAQAAHVLKEVGQEGESQLVFGEILERASRDPWAHALVGDHLRRQADWGGAIAAYEALLDLVPGDGSSQIRLALAYYGARRIDAAFRLLARVSETGGRTGREELTILSDRLLHALVRQTLAEDETPEEKARLEQFKKEMRPLGGGTTFVVMTSAGTSADRVWLKRGANDQTADLLPPVSKTGQMGVAVLEAPAGPSGPMRLVLSRKSALSPSDPVVANLYAIANDKLFTKAVTLPITGTLIEVPFDADKGFSEPKVGLE